MTDHSHTALILVDNQIGAFDPNFWGKLQSSPSYLENIKTLLLAFRSVSGGGGSPGPRVIHVYHRPVNPLSPLHPSSPGMDFHPSSTPIDSEPVFGKSTNSAFIKPELAAFLNEQHIWKLYFAGLSIDLCLGSTIRHASDLGIGDHVGEKGELVKGDIVVIEDAVAAWSKKGGKYDAETVNGVHIESLKGEFARVAATEGVLKEMGLNNET